MQNRRLWVFRLITFILLPLLLLAGLEGTLRLIAPGHSTDFTTRTVVDGVAVRRENARFAWQFFPAGIAREPLAISFPDEKPESAYRIFVLGGSSAQGDPEPTYGFSRILGLMLERRYPGVHFELINTAMTAINSHVVYPIAQEVAGLQADLFVIYLGNNEVVGPYGAGTVFAPLLPSLPFIRFLMSVKASHIGQNLARLLQRLGPEEAGGAERWRGMAMFLDRQVRADDPGMEKVYSHFRANLEDTLDVIRSGGAEAMVSTVATNLRDSAPFASQHRDHSSERDLAKWDEFHAKGVALAEAGRYPEACAQLLAAEKLDDTHAGLQFLLGRCHGEMGESREALRRYRLAQELDTLRFRADSGINRIIRETAADRADEGVFLVDAAKEMEARSANGIPGGDLFYEHVHMNFRGNYLLAKSLFQQLERILPSEVVRFRDEDGDLPTFEESMRALALTGYDRHRIAAEVLDRLGRPPFTNQLNHDEVMEQAQRREAELRRFTTPDGLLEARREYEQALRGRGEDPWLHHNFAMLLYAAGSFEAAAEQLRIFLAFFPQHAVARERLLAALIQMGRFEEAADSSREALRIDPDSNAAKYALAVSYSKLGKEEEAIAFYRSLLRDDPERAPDIYNELGQLYFRKARHAEAIEAFKAGIGAADDAGRGDRPDMAFNLGVAFKREGRTEAATRAFSEAISGYRKRIQKNPRSATLHLGLGSVYVEMRNFVKAAESFRMAIESKPADLQAHLNLARSLEAQGHLREAQEALRAGEDRMLLLGERESAGALQRYRGALQARTDQRVRGTSR